MSERAPSALTVSEALRRGAALLKDSETPQLDARILLKHALSVNDSELIARASSVLSGDKEKRYFAALKRRAAFEPVAYITGEKEFWSLPFRVTRDVLIPRNDSECLIEAALARRGKNARLRILDLGTGSGCLLCALLSEFPESSGVGVDISAAALVIAEANAHALGLGDRAAFVQGDWLTGIGERFDLLIANPPYIPVDTRKGLPQSVAAYEPAEALFAGEDGLDAYRTIVENLRSALANDGLVILECGDDQAGAISALLGHLGGPNPPFTLHDLAGRPRGAGLDLRKPEKNY